MRTANRLDLLFSYAFHTRNVICPSFSDFLEKESAS